MRDVILSQECSSEHKEEEKVSKTIRTFVIPQELEVTRVIFYVRRIGLYLYKYRIYGTISIYILKGPAFVYQLIQISHH